MRGGAANLRFISPLILGVLAVSVAADDATPTDRQPEIARLEALFEAQQERIECLQAHLTAPRTQDQDAARVEAMKQQIREVLSGQEFRENLMPSMLQAGYDQGFYIRSSHEKFLKAPNRTCWGTGRRPVK